MEPEEEWVVYEGVKMSLKQAQEIIGINVIIEGDRCSEVMQAAWVCNMYENCLWDSKNMRCYGDPDFIYPTRSPTPEPTQVIDWDNTCN